MSTLPIGRSCNFNNYKGVFCCIGETQNIRVYSSHGKFVKGIKPKDSVRYVSVRPTSWCAVDQKGYQLLPIVKKLEHKNWKVRERAILELAKLGKAAAPVIPVLRKIIYDLRNNLPNPCKISGIEYLRDRGHLRWITAKGFNYLLIEGVFSVLKNIGQGALPLLVSLLNDRNANIRLLASESLKEMRIKTHTVLRSLAKNLNDHNVWVRLSVVDALYSWGTTAVPYLKIALKDGHGWVRDRAILQLHRLGEKSIICVRDLVILSISDPIQMIRKKSAQAVAEIAPTKAIALLNSTLRNRRWKIRKAAVEALRYFNSRALPLLKIALRDSSYRVRKAVVFSVYDIDASGVIALLRRALKDRNWRVRKAAVAVLANKVVRYYPDNSYLELISLLRSALNDQNFKVRMTVVKESERFIGLPSESKRFINELIYLMRISLKDHDWRIRKASVKRLGSLHGKAKLAFSEIKKLLIDRNASVRIAAADALYKICCVK
ncbi:MAG: HEAT repeat domain-containing protein [Pseudomonadota bacterium]